MSTLANRPAIVPVFGMRIRKIVAMELKVNGKIMQSPTLPANDLDVAGTDRLLFHHRHAELPRGRRPARRQVGLGRDVCS